MFRINKLPFGNKPGETVEAFFKRVFDYVEANAVDKLVLGETFSAAQNTINELEKYTNAIFVGEPTAANPNHFGDSRNVVLRNSKISVRASTLWWQDMDPRDTRKWRDRDIQVERGRLPAFGERLRQPG